MASLRWFLTLAGSFLIVGCSGGPRLHPVKGTVSVEGEPSAEGLTITFLPVEAKEGARPATGKVDANGQFELMSFKQGDGAYAGEYKVVVSMPAVLKLPPKMQFPKDSKFVPEPIDPSKKAPTVHANYQDGGKTPLRGTVPAPEGGIRLELKKNGT